MLLARRFFDDWSAGEPAAAVAGLAAGAVMAYLLYRFVRRVPWPRPFRFRFVLVHLAAAPVFGVLWILLTIAIESLFTGSLLDTRTGRRAVELPSELPETALLLYVIVIGIAYSVERRERAAYAAAEAARAQLATLRAQLHPHFLFNSLHTVVQLIHIDPPRAAEAAELVGSLLRRTLEDQRDEVTLDEEWTFVSRYIEVEQIRFGDRLRVRAELDPDLLDEKVPSFALQTLVENAVRHGAANRVAPTDIVVTAALADSKLSLSVSNTGDPLPTLHGENGVGTGLSRLRQRLAFLYGDAARLSCGARAGLRAMLTAFEWVEVVGEAADGETALTEIDRLQPELVFLDVQMPGLLGTDVVRRLERQPYIIFTTAFSQHAVTAFELGAVDYLLKPFGRTRLAAAMERIRGAIGEPLGASALERLTGALGGGPISRLFVRTGGNLVPLLITDVASFEADDDYVIAYTARGRHTLSLSLSGLEERLDPKRFVRVHRAHIVNLDHVRAFKRDTRGNLEAELADGRRVPVSRARAQELRSLGL